jgi:hypothetical protein
MRTQQLSTTLGHDANSSHGRMLSHTQAINSQYGHSLVLSTRHVAIQHGRRHRCGRTPTLSTHLTTQHLTMTRHSAPACPHSYLLLLLYAVFRNPASLAHNDPAQPALIPLHSVWSPNLWLSATYPKSPPSLPHPHEQQAAVPLRNPSAKTCEAAAKIVMQQRRPEEQVPLLRKSAPRCSPGSSVLV